MSCPRRRTCGGGSSWSYSWSTSNGVTTYRTSGNVPQQYLQQIPAKTQQSSGTQQSTQKTSSSGNSGSKTQNKGDACKDYYEYGLYLHNWYRKRHGSPPLTLDARLNKLADAYAYNLARRRVLQHSSGLDYNENLFMSYDTSLSKKEYVRQACKCWYDEVKLYNFNNPGFSMQTGHFTAMVFKSVKQLGIGVGVAANCVVVVGAYKPHANMSGQFRTNVLPYRNVPDTSEEEESESESESENEGESSSEEEAKKQPEVKKEPEVKKVEEAKKSASAEEKKSKKNDKEQEEIAYIKNIFEEKCDKDGTIGWSELKDLLQENFKVEWEFEGFDKSICCLLISMMTLRDGEKKRINLDDFKKIGDSVIGFMDAYSEFDKDQSGLLDPFELKMALQEAGFDISYKTYQTLQKVFGMDDSGELNFRGFVLCFILLSKLQIVQEKRKSFEDFSMKEWMEKELKLAAKE